ncbi:uncharacterized protein LOC123676387 isoform X2 [Harmonia axyridis]|uniref:uncharacterized protein LOC123676387 isoform X2 n=1 Tax=Harmonia axyridis TaxID=115357 RepID=UPI001E277FF4|nr:uncharacterized protein LOC123676387 isoform X2 [Harmonia axyridis]
MSQEEYDKKLRSVHRFIPFLENIITQLKDPKMKNREQQLSKMESLYQMIMDKNKKLKLETLNKCEDVIIKLFYKRGKNAILPPIYNMNTTNKQGDKRKSIDLYSLAGETINKQDTFNELYGGTSSGNLKSPRRPPISYSDLECLEKDVAHELEKKMSLQELNTLRYRLCRELEGSKPDEINTTVRNKPVPTKLNPTSPDKNRKKAEITMNVQQKNEPSVTKKIDSKPTAPKVLKEAGDLFGNAFSEIDKSYGLGSKKKDDSKYNKEKKDVEMENEKASLKQLSEKAAQLRRNVKPIENEKVEKTSNGTKYPFESIDVTPLRTNDSDNVPLRPVNTRNNDVKDKEKSVSVNVPKIDNSKEEPKKEKNEIDDFKEKNKKEKNEIGEFKEKNERGKSEKDYSKEKNKSTTDSNMIPLKIPNNRAVDSSENKEKSKSSTDVSNITNMIPLKIPNNKAVDSSKNEERSKSSTDVSNITNMIPLKNPNNKAVDSSENKEKSKSSTNVSNITNMIPLKIPNNKAVDSSKNKERSKSSTDVSNITNMIPLKNPNNKAVDSSENKEKSKSSTDVSNITNNGDCKDQAKTTIKETGSEADTVSLKITMSDNVIPKNESNKVINKLITYKDKDHKHSNKADQHRDKNRIEKEKSRNETEKTTLKYSEDKNNKSKSKSSKCPNDKEKKRSDYKEKHEKNHKSDHKKDKEEKHKDKNREKSHKEHDKDKDHKDRSKDKDNREKKSKSAEIKDGAAEKKSFDKNKDCKEDKKEKQMKELEQDIAKNAASKQKDATSVVRAVPNKITFESENANVKNYQDDYEQLTQKLNEMIETTTKTHEKPKIENEPQISEKPLKEVKAETKAINRDPRLKQGSLQNLTTDRIAFKYNPKPKRQEADADLEKDVVDSIEKSMKESNVPMPPAVKLTAPPAPPSDLFSPESPDEIDKMAVPPILNDLLLNPKTTGMLNEVVSALRRSNNDSNLISIATSANVCSGESNQLGQTFNQTPALRFSPPVPKINFEAPPVEAQIFSPPKQTRCFTSFSDQKEFDYQPKRNQGPPSSHLNSYEERIGQSYFGERTGCYVAPSLNYSSPTLNYVPPSPSYGPSVSSFIPPSPNYVPPSPIYEGNAETFRDMNYQNFQGSNSQRFFDGDRGSIRAKGLLGDAPSRFNNPYQKNYDNFNSFGLRGSSSNLSETRPNYYGGSRDPRINMNRGLQYTGQDIRPIARESRMTYREYKEQKEREKREREMREREIKEKEELDRKQKEREEIETNANSVKEREIVSNSQVENEKDRTSIKVEEKESDRSRTRDRSRDRYSRNRSSSRYRKDRDDYRSRGDRRDRNERRDRSRERSRFDKAYSVREKDKGLSSPLNELFNPKSTIGKGYSTQYKIPKKIKDEEQSKEDNVKNDDTAKIEKSSVKKKSSDEKFRHDNKLRSENVTESKKEEDEIPEKQINVQEVEPKEETITNQKRNKNMEEETKKENDEKTTESKLDTEQKTDSKEDKKCNIGEKKEEEENILSKFFQNLMKSGNKDEKKGALLSLISTFSDSFSDQQMQKITSIIKSEDDIDEPNKKENEQEKQDIPSNQLKEIKVDDKTESIPEGDTPEQIEEEIEPEKEEPADEPIEAEELPEKNQTIIKSEILKPELKSKMKTKSELDRLHDDIREMFIRDGVVTATGKRMCRILKDTSPQKSSTQEKLEEEVPPEETEKKITTLKRRGRKPGYRKNKETPEVEMKELSVILPKMSLDKIKSADEVLEKEKHCEGDDEADKKEENSSEEEASDKEPVEKTSPIRRGRYKKRNSWATGVIKRKPCPKSKKHKIQDVTEEKKSVKDAEAELDIETNTDKKLDIPKEGLHEIDYYLKIGQTRLQCKYCEVSTKWIAAHYRTEHPNEEVLSSRLAPHVAKAAIADAIKNREIYENDKEESMSKHEFLCSFCEYKQITLPKFYRDHVSIHTGEFRHTCPYCSFSRSHIKTMQTHVTEVHAEEEATSKKPLISERAPNNRNTYAYICELCNFTQMNLDNVTRHVENYHSQYKCQIHKIKVNCIEKIEEKTADNNTVLSERPTRRLLKSNSQPEEITASPSQEATKPSNIEVSPKEEEAKTLEDESLGSCDTSNTEEESTETDKPRNIQTVSRRTRKRGKIFKAPPSPVKKRLKRRCTLNRLSTTDFDDDTFEEIEEKTAKNIDEAVFTSNTDIQEENKRIEEERLKTMQDINSTIKLRTSSDFVEKLSHKLKQEEEVTVKQEVEEIIENVLEKTPVKDLPVFEKSGIQIREAEPVSIRQETSPKMGKDSGKVNPINGVIEKLQGILGNPPTSCDNVASPNIPSEELSLPSIEPTFDDNPPSLEIAETKIFPKECVGNEAILPPPLIHMNNVEQTVEKSNMVNSEILNIGYVKVIKTMGTYIYVCCLPPCIFSSRDRTVFARHCQYNHQWDENSPKTSQCLECGETFTCSEGGNLLTSALDHTNSHHSNFLGIKIGSIRISTNLFPESRGSSERPSTPPTISIPSPPGNQLGDDIDCFFSNDEPPAETNEGENPFSFKIVDVVSLAEDNLTPLNTSDKVVEPQSPDKEPGPSQIQPDSSSLSKMQTMKLLMSKCKSKQEEALSRKWPTAMKKFLSNYFDLYKCPDYSCVFTTNKRKMFDIHLRTHPNNKKKVNCLYCDKLIDFDTSGDHYEKLHGMCRFSCSYCLYRCIAKDYMDIHQVLAHPDMQSRMQLLPKRDLEDKSSISILSEATKLSPITPYLCCDKEYLHQIPFIEHVENCLKNTNFRCYYGKGMNSCQTPHSNSKDLVNHWGTTHDVYPLKCAYCSVGDFDLNVMMIHLVLEHPTLPPDIIDRYNTPVSRNKKPPTISSVQCNFKELVFKLKSYSNCLVPKTAESLQLPVTSPTVTPPKTMQTAFENFVQMSNSKTISPLPKVAPLSIAPSIALLKPTSKANVINAGSVVYCLSPAPNSQQSLFKAIVVNKDKTMVSQKLQLVAPMSSKTDGKYQIVNKIMPMAPPKLAPLTAIQNMSSMNKVISSSSDIITLNSPDASNQVNPNVITTGMEERLCNIQKDGNIAGDSADMENLEEPMVVIDDDLNNERDEAVDPLSLDTEHSSSGQVSKTPQPNATPMQDYDSDSKDIDQHEMLVQKSGLVGYQLFRCAKCDMFFPGSWQFKEHLINSTQCKFENSPQKPYKCFHCGKYLKHYTNLLDHLTYHGPPRFTCSLCNKKFPHANQVKYHMKTQHNVINVQMQPLIQTKANLNNDSFIAKPPVIGCIKSTIKETNSEIDAHKATEVKTVYYSFEADQIPQKSILGYDITCGHCKKFKNKVRSNIVRHLLLHQNDKDFTVPDTAPVNPVPCLEKNEKMFDKMCNLASSSHTGGRMGGQQKGESSKDKAKDNNYPAFVPSNKRYQCCAVGCNYLCLEEGNLRHHLTALHMEDLNFVCVHCKRDLSDAVDVDTIIKHLKLHDLHLYKCSYCDYMHNLKHKIERHIGDDHKNKESTVVTIRAMDAEPYDDNQQQPFIPVAFNQKLQKPWKCCMCKYKCQMEEEVMNHVKNKHNIDCRYKCALCTFKTNGVSEFKEHFKTNHPEGAIDIISVYHKDDENSEQVPENDQFDTTPLWLRDKPRVRHIRGILFEDDTAMKKKAAPVKTDPSKELSGTSTTKKRKRSMSTVNEPFKLEDEGIQPKKETIEPKIGNKAFGDVIVIEDDEVDGPSKTDNKKVDPVDNQDLNDIELICRFGDFGMPLNKHFKCPKCEKYKTTKMRDFIQHVAGELRYYRFSCKICQEKFITLENIQMHCIDYHDCSVKSLTHLPVDEAINKWLTSLLIEQRKIMVSLGLACDEVPTHIEDFLGRMEVLPRRTIKCKECGFAVSGSQALDRHMKYNHPHIAFTPKSQPPKPSEPAQQTSTSGKKRLSVASLEGVTQPKKIKMTKTIPMVKDKYVCNDCGIEFNSVPEMEYHSKENHNGLVGYTIKKTNLPINSGVLRITYRCRYCSTTGIKSYLEVHISNDHPGQKIDVYRFSCGFCSAKFETLKSFKQHFKSHDLPDMFYYDVYDRKVALQQSSISTTPKVKIYKCPKCPYKSKSSNPNNIKLHLTLHAKPFQCGICQGLFKTKRQARTHHLNEHPHNNEVITTLQEMFKLADQMLKEIIDTATIVEERDNTLTDDLIEESLELAIQPEVLQSNDEFVDIETMENDISGEKELSRVAHKEKKHFAKKSTGLNIKSDETKEYFSFYGEKAESVDLKKITTNFEIGGSRVKISCEKLSRMYNLNPILELNDCMTLIIDDDEALTS